MKPVVRFSQIMFYPNVGSGAIVWPIDHPSSLVSNTTWVTTSPVVSITTKDGKGIVEFETMNTIYKLENEVEPTSQNCH